MLAPCWLFLKRRACSMPFFWMICQAARSPRNTCTAWSTACSIALGCGGPNVKPLPRSFASARMAVFHQRWKTAAFHKPVAFREGTAVLVTCSTRGSVSSLPGHFRSQCIVLGVCKLR